MDHNKLLQAGSAPASPVKQKQMEREEREYRARDDMRVIKSHEEICRDPDRIKAVREIAKKDMDGLKKLASIQVPKRKR